MDKLSVVIDPKEWGNLVTKYQPHSPTLSPTDFTDGTINLDTDTNGSLTKRKGGPNYNASLLSAAPKDQFEAIFSDGARHLLVVANGEIRYSTGDTLFNSVVNGTGFSAGANFEFATTQDRVYMDNGITGGQVYDRATSYGGVTYTAPRLRPMGVQAPATPPTVAVVAGGSVPIGGHTYKITFLYYDAEESNGGPASAVATTSAGNQTVNLSAIPIGAYGVTARNIYRDNNDGNWLFITQISNNTATTYSDTISVSATPTPIPINNGNPPIFRFITNWINRLWLSGIPGDPSILFYSEADQPDIYGSENQILCNSEDPITATIVYFDRLIVFNRHSMGQIIGSTPDTFRYAAIPSSIGCVDNRTLQIRALEGVPVLIWLSERGFYSYDGNSIEYISDVIENLVNFNIRQAVQQKNSNTQTTQTQFQSGTPSNGIELVLSPGTITTRGYSEGSSTPGTNPRRDWNDQGDWDGGSSKINAATKDGSNTLKAVTRFAPSLGSGGLSGSAIISGTLKLTTTTAFNGEASTPTTPTADLGPIHSVAVPIIPTRAGTITAIKFRVGRDAPPFGASITYPVTLETDGGGVPSGTVLANTTIQGNVNANTLLTSGAISVNLAAGTTYWMVVRLHTGPIDFIRRVLQGNTISGGATKWQQDNGSGTATSGFVAAPFTAAAGYNFTYAKVPSSGRWTSPIYDTFCDNVPNGAQGTISFSTFSIPNSSVTLVGGVVEASNDPFFLTPTVVSTQPPISFQPFTFSLQTFRFWRLKVDLTTNDNVFTPSVSAPILTYVASQVSQPAEWISEAIDTTSDVTVYNSLDIVSSTPAGTSLSIQIATSANNISYTSFVNFGSHTIQRYAKIRVRLTMTSDQATSPTVTSISLTWTLVANLISSPIDTAVVPPAGWDVFLSQFASNGGTVQFFLSSAPSTGQLGDGGHPFTSVTNGNFPTVIAFQYAQWKVIITSANNTVPTVDSVTVQWFIASVNSVRPASIFVDGRYYVALAQLDQTVNNLLLEIDLKGKWRRLSGLSVSTFSFFFNRPYLGLATSGQIRKFLEGYMDGGGAIEFDVRTKALDYSTPYKDVSDKFKVVGELIVHAKNTGALLQFLYSVDEGANWFPFYTLSGASSYQTTTDGKDFFLRVKPNWSNGNPITGHHLMYRIYNNDLFQVEIHTLKAQAMVRKGPPVVTG